MNDLRFEKTSDGSITLWDTAYKESMHSSSGAYQEAVLKHIYPSLLMNKLTKPLFILDVGFGLGYNILALLMELRERNYLKPITIHSFEINRNYSDYIDSIVFNDNRDQLYTLLKYAYKEGQYETKGISIKIHFGDARQSINALTNIIFDTVFQDPYSPSKNPELWTVQFFKLLYNIMSNDSILTTYSSAPQVRGALLSAGFIIGRGPSVGKKKEGTLASKGNKINIISDSDIINLLNDYRSTPYSDLSLHDSRDEILERRLAEMRFKRHSISSSSCKTDLSD